MNSTTPSPDLFGRPRRLSSLSATERAVRLLTHTARIEAALRRSETREQIESGRAGFVKLIGEAEARQVLAISLVDDERDSACLQLAGTEPALCVAIESVEVAYLTAHLARRECPVLITSQGPTP